MIGLEPFVYLAEKQVNMGVFKCNSGDKKMEIVRKCVEECMRGDGHQVTVELDGVDLIFRPIKGYEHKFGPGLFDSDIDDYIETEMYDKNIVCFENKNIDIMRAERKINDQRYGDNDN